ncbi:hypothetical protein [Corallococcus sp. 4LFB]|uniref:hypothetical protein n=1 Tax=Corallococcus sp. 4LFB TaxID=3383249 RepID=UPI0039750071
MPAFFARYSSGGPFALSAVAHALRVPPSQAARMRLDPSRAYGLRVEGRVSVGGPLPVAQAVYFLEGGTALAARDSFGLVGADEVLVRDASVLYVFLWDDRPDDNRGALQVHVREQASGAITTLLLDARRHAVSLSPLDGFTLRELDPSTTYRVVVRAAQEPARTRGLWRRSGGRRARAARRGSVSGHGAGHAGGAGGQPAHGAARRELAAARVPRRRRERQRRRPHAGGDAGGAAAPVARATGRYRAAPACSRKIDHPGRAPTLGRHGGRS